MRSSILHITNEDSTTNYLKKLHFSGDFITWREMLCEGKTTTDVGSETFWKNRFTFLKSSYNISKQNFINYTLKEYRNLCNKKETKEIVLWFEHHLSSQINMIAVINWLKKHRKGYHISLVNTGKIKNSKPLNILSELNENQIQEHYKNRIHLTQDDIEYADYIWELYCSDSPLRLETVYMFNPISPFQYLAKAIEIHLSRFPSIKNGLNIIENSILEIANTHQLSSKNKFASKLLKVQTNYGFGELQYNHKIAQLHKLFTSFNPVKLSRKGKKVLKNQLNFYSELSDENSYIGGAKKYSFLYNNQLKKLLQITS